MRRKEPETALEAESEVALEAEPEVDEEEARRRYLAGEGPSRLHPEKPAKRE